MSFSILTLLSKSHTLLKAEKLILAPYLIFFLIIHSVMNIYSISLDKPMAIKGNIILFLIVGWVVELFFKGLTISMAYHVYNENNDQKKTSLSFPLHYTLIKFHHLLLSVGSLMIPFFLIAKYILPSNQGDPFSLLLSTIGLFLMLFFVFIIHILPVMVLVDNLNWYQAIQLSFSLIKNNIKNIIMFTGLIFSLLIVMFFLTALFNTIPILGDTLFQVIFKALGYTYLYVITTLFYVLILSPKKGLSQKDTHKKV